MWICKGRVERSNFLKRKIKMYYVIGNGRIIEQSQREIDKKSLQTHAMLNGFEFYEYTGTTSGEIKVEKVELLNVLFKQSMEQVKIDVIDPEIKYTEEEIQTWPQQLSEAKEYLADSGAVTPMISSMAMQRDITVYEMADRITTAANTYSTIAGNLLGKRQAIMREILETSGDINLIDVGSLWLK